MYKILNNLSSPLIDDLITKTTLTRVTRNSLKVDPSKYPYVSYKRLFRYRAAHIWINIPECLNLRKIILRQFQICTQKVRRSRKIDIYQKQHSKRAEL